MDGVFLKRQQEVTRMLLTLIIDSIRPLPSVDQLFADERREDSLVERREYRPPLSGRVYKLAIAPKRRNQRIGKTRGVPLLFFR